MRNKIILGSFILSALAYSNSDNPSKRYLSPTSNYEKIFFTELETRDNERREELYSNILRVIDMKNNDKGEYKPLTSGSEFDNLEAGKLKLIPIRQLPSKSKTEKYQKGNENGIYPVTSILKNGNKNLKYSDLNITREYTSKELYFGNGNKIKDLKILTTDEFDKTRKELVKDEKIKYEIAGIYNDVGGYGNITDSVIGDLDTKDLTSNKLGITLKDYQTNMKGKSYDEQLKYLKGKLEVKHPDKQFVIENNKIYSKFKNRHNEDEKWEVLWKMKEVSAYDPYTNKEIEEPYPKYKRPADDYFVKTFPEFYTIDKKTNTATLKSKYFDIDAKNNIGTPKKQYFRYDTRIINGKETIVGEVHIDKEAAVYFKDLLLSTVFVYDEFKEDTRGEIIYTKDGDIFIQDKANYDKDNLSLALGWSSPKVLQTIIEENKDGNSSNIVGKYFKDKNTMDKKDFEEKWVKPFEQGGVFEQDLKKFVSETNDKNIELSKKEKLKKEYSDIVDNIKNNEKMPTDFYEYMFAGSDENRKKYKASKSAEVQKLLDQYDVENGKLEKVRKEIDELEKQKEEIAKKYHFSKSWTATDDEKKWIDYIVNGNSLSLLKNGKTVSLYENGRVEGTIDLGKGLNELVIISGGIEALITKIILAPTASLKNINLVKIGKQVGDRTSTTGKTTLALDIDENIKNNKGEITGHALYNSDKDIIFINGETQVNENRNDFSIELMTSKIGKDSKIDIGRPLKYKAPGVLYGSKAIEEYKLTFIPDSITDNIVESEKENNILEVKKKKSLKRLTDSQNDVYRSILNSGQIGFLSDTLSTINKKTNFTSFEEEKQNKKRVQLAEYLLTSNKNNEQKLLKDISEFNYEPEQIKEMLKSVEKLKKSQEYKEESNKIDRLSELKKVNLNIKNYDKIKELYKNENYVDNGKKTEDIKNDLLAIYKQGRDIFDSSIGNLQKQLDSYKLEEAENVYKKISEIKNTLDDIEYKATSRYTDPDAKTVVDLVKELKDKNEELDKALDELDDILNSQNTREVIENRLIKRLERYDEFVHLFGKLYYTPKQEEALNEFKTLVNQLYEKNIYSHINKIAKNEIDVFSTVVYNSSYDFEKADGQARGGALSGRFSHGNFKGNIYTAYGMYENKIGDKNTLGFLVGGGTSNHKEIKNDTLKELTTTSKIKGTRAYLGGYNRNILGKGFTWTNGIGMQYSKYDVDRDFKNNYQQEKYKGKVNAVAGNIYTSLDYVYKINETLDMKLRTGLSYTIVNQGKVKEDKKPLALDVDSKNFNYLDGQIGIGLTKKIYGRSTVSSLSGEVSSIYGITGYENDDLVGNIVGSSYKFNIKGNSYRKDAIKINLDYNVEDNLGFSYGIEGNYIKNSEEDNISIGIKGGYKF